MRKILVGSLILGAWLGGPRVEARQDAPAASPRTVGVCEGCREKAESPAIAVIGPCAFCKEGYTPTPVFKACFDCAAKRGICRVCLKPLATAGGAGAPGAAGGAEPGVAPSAPGDTVDETPPSRPAAVPGFCADCRKRGNDPRIESSAQCALCKKAWTASGDFKACDRCAIEKKVCVMCLRALKGSSPMKPADGGAGKPGAVEGGPKRTIEQVKETHGDDLMALRGVVGNGIGEVKGRPALILYVETKEDAKRLDALLEDEIEGYSLKIVASGKAEAR